MNTATAAKDAVREAREGVNDIGNAASAASGTIERDVETLREDFTRLAQQVGDILSDRGNAAWRRAKASVDGVVADAQGKGREAADAMREVSDNFVDAIDNSLATRPYTTLAIVAGLGFLVGATWRR
jgi:ElaB/YqjD/DUF883 family membrane-anchored ribosome-binding protein